MNNQSTQSTIEAQVRFAMTQLTTGINMHYAEYGDETGETLIFLHGLSDSWFSFSTVLEHLSPKYHVYMPDIRGHGNSSQPESSYALEDFADDVIAFVEALALQNITLIGHSLGSFVAQYAASMMPDKVARLVLIGSATKPFTEDMVEFQTLFSTFEDPVPEEALREFQTSTLYGAVSADFLNRVISESAKLRAHVWRETSQLLTGDGALFRLDKLVMPTLIVWGDQDTIWSRSEQDALVAHLPDAELRVYPQTGHALHWEQPEQFARDLIAFIERTM